MEIRPQEAAYAPITAPSPRPAPSAPPDTHDAPRDHPAIRTWGWIALGGAGAAAIVAGIAGVEGLQARDAFDASGETSVSLHDKAATYRTVANVAWAVAGASAVCGVVLLVLPVRSRATDVVASPASLAVRVRF